MVYRIVAIGFAILFLSGCVVGRKHAFQQSKAVLDYQGEPVAVGVQDLRPYIVSGDKDEDFAGLARRIRYSLRHRHRVQPAACAGDGRCDRRRPTQLGRR